MTERLNNLITPNQPCASGCLEVPDKRTISLPSPDSDREMAIRCSDWKRIERGLEDALDLPTDFSTLYGILFGLSGSSGFSLIPLAMTKDLPVWVLPAYIAFTSAFLFCGVFVFFFSREQRKKRKKMLSDLLEHIKEIGDRFAPTSNQDRQNICAEEYELPNRAIP